MDPEDLSVAISNPIGQFFAVQNPLATSLLAMALYNISRVDAATRIQPSYRCTWREISEYL